MPNVSDLFNFANFSDRKKFTILVVGMVLYFGWANDRSATKIQELADKRYNSLFILYNEVRSDNKDLRRENKSLLIENSQFYKIGTPKMDSIKLDVKTIKTKLKIK